MAVALLRGLGWQPWICGVALVRVRAKAPRSSAVDNDAHGCHSPLEGVVVDPLSVTGLLSENRSPFARS